ncbi:DMT family transporter [Halobacillus sp. Marseille-Q1614]|uniref:DMT family transporter n=1 Tax=Halobacillus sp. Marseille-Q1614 TaxID=2709134 RepID=UPI00156DA846|nr:DMT family transporter [Halobacillus sp. Marseille-Q1614]
MRLLSALVGLSLIWGLSFVFIENLIGPAGVWGTVFLRCLAGAVILTPLFIIKMKQINSPLPWKSLITLGVVNAALPWGLIALSQTEITSNTAAVLNASTPIMTGLIGFFIFSVILRKKQWAGIILGFIGILILMNFDVAALFSEDFIGIGTMVLATACYGFGSQFTKRYLKGFNIVILTTISLYIGAAAGAVLTAVSRPGFYGTILSSVDMNLVISLIGLGCFGSGIAHLLLYYLINNGGPEYASTVTYLVPVSALFWGSFLLDEPVTKNLVAGLLIIFTGVFLASQNIKFFKKPFLMLERRG